MLRIKTFDFSDLIGDIEANMAAIILAKKNADRAAGKALAKAMRDTITYQKEDWTPLSPTTILRRGPGSIGGGRMLLDTGLMRKSIKYKLRGDSVTVGVHADAPDRRQKIAAIQEYGDPLLNIPARPFINSTWNREKDRIEDIWYSAMGRS